MYTYREKERYYLNLDFIIKKL